MELVARSGHPPQVSVARANDGDCFCSTLPVQVTVVTAFASINAAATRAPERRLQNKRRCDGVAKGECEIVCLKLAFSRNRNIDQLPCEFFFAGFSWGS